MQTMIILIICRKFLDKKITIIVHHKFIWFQRDLISWNCQFLAALVSFESVSPLSGAFVTDAINDWLKYSFRHLKVMIYCWLLRAPFSEAKNDHCQDFPHADAASSTRLYPIFQLHKRSILLIINDSWLTTLDFIAFLYAQCRFHLSDKWMVEDVRRDFLLQIVSRRVNLIWWKQLVVKLDDDMQLS